MAPVQCQRHQPGWRLLAACLATVAAECVRAQIGVDLKTDRGRYIQYEPIRVTVTLRNYTGNSLVFGLDPKTEGSLRFVVETPDGIPIRILDKDANPASGLILGAGETRTISIPLNTVFNMQREGTYVIYVQVSHPRLASDYRSARATVDVLGGAVVWSRPVGIPCEKPSERIPARTMSLLAFHEGKADAYCLRIEDEQMVYGVLRLGPRIVGVAPECDVDSVSSIHVLFLMRPRLYAYRVYDYNGQLKQDRYYVLETTAPHLQRDPDIGRITIVGGRAAVAGVDYQVLEEELKPGTEAEAGASQSPAAASAPGPQPAVPPATPPARR